MGLIYSKHFCISGRVQGVFYRASTRDKARELGLVGWVRNLPDGRVEAVACGSSEALAAFENWLWEGPPRAEVTDVSSREQALGDWRSFEVC